jgi:alginate lyase
VQKPSSSVAAMLVCSLTSGAAWLCGTQPIPPIRPAPPPVTTPVAPVAVQPPVVAPLPPTPAPQPAASKASNNRQPGDVIDLKNWYLTLPSGSAGDPDTVQQPKLASYTSKFFRLNDTRDGVAFTATAGGTTTENSHYPRAELREMNGSAKAAWSNTRGTHTLTARQAITALPTAKPEIVSAQIHGGDDDVMQVRLEGTKLVVQYDDGKSEIVMDPKYKVGTVFDVKIVAAGGRILVSYNGAQKAEIKQSGSGWYFKSGSYLQSNTSKGDKPNAEGTVVIYSLKVTHSN